MDTCSAGHLRQAGYRLLDIATGDHHQVSQFVDDDNHVGEVPVIKLFTFDQLDFRQILFHHVDDGIVVGSQLAFAGFLLLFLLQLAIVAVDVAHALVGHQLVAAFHLANRPVQGQRRLFRIGNDRQQEMRDPLVHREFQHFRVDHDQANIARVSAIEQREDHGIDRDRFTGTG